MDSLRLRVALSRQTRQEATLPARLKAWRGWTGPATGPGVGSVAESVAGRLEYVGPREVASDLN